MILGDKYTGFYGLLIALCLSTTTPSAQLRDERIINFLETEKFLHTDSALRSRRASSGSLDYLVTSMNEGGHFFLASAFKQNLALFGPANFYLVYC